MPEIETVMLAYVWLRLMKQSYAKASWSKSGMNENLKYIIARFSGKEYRYARMQRRYRFRSLSETGPLQTPV